MNKIGLKKWIRKALRSTFKEGSHEKKETDKPTRNRLFLLRMGLSYVRLCALGILVRIDKHDRLSAILVCSLIPMPIVGAWFVISYLLGVPIDWLRATLIWLFIFILSFFAGATDWKKAVEKHG